jgi:hypothetical protein
MMTSDLIEVSFKHDLGPLKAGVAYLLTKDEVRRYRQAEKYIDIAIAVQERDKAERDLLQHIVGGYDDRTNIHA